MLAYSFDNMLGGKASDFGFYNRSLTGDWLGKHFAVASPSPSTVFGLENRGEIFYRKKSWKEGEFNFFFRFLATL